MSQYKVPMTNAGISILMRNKFETLLLSYIGSNDNELTPYNVNNDEAVGIYNDAINDGESPKQAKSAADQHYFELLEQMLEDFADDLESAWIIQVSGLYKTL